MELTPSLRVHLDALAPYLDDKAVTEVLVAAPERVLVARGAGLRPVEIELAEPRVRALADRLIRSLGLRSRPDRPEVQSVEIGDLFITVVGAVRGARCPLIRVQRRVAMLDSLDQLEARGEIDPNGRMALEAAIAERRSVLITGPRGARSTDFVAALARLWHTHGRVGLLEDGQAVLAALGVATFAVDGVSIAHALSLGADVLIAEEPTPVAWTRLLESGRPFVASVEAADASAALQRVVALGLAGGPHLSRAAAEALALASVGTIVELSAVPNSSALKGLHKPVLLEGALAVDSLTGSGRPAESARPKPRVPAASRTPAPEPRPAPPPVLDTPLVDDKASTRPAPTKVARPEPTSAAARRVPSRPVLRPARPGSGPGAALPGQRPVEVVEDLGRGLSSSVAARFDDPELSDILPESLLSNSFVGRFQAAAGDETRRGSAKGGEAFVRLPEAATLEPGGEAVPTPDLGENEVGFSEEDTDGTKELAARRGERPSVERLPTISIPPPTPPSKVGLRSEIWAHREFKGGPEETAPPEAADAETGLGLPKSAFAQRPTLPEDSDESEVTYQADGAEMARTTGSLEAQDPSAEDVFDSREEESTEGGEADWDPDAPSEVIEPSDRQRLVDPLAESDARRRRIR